MSLTSWLLYYALGTFREDFYFIFSANNKYKANKKLRWNVVTNDVK